MGYYVCAVNGGSGRSLTTSLFFFIRIFFVTHRPLHADAAGGHYQQTIVAAIAHRDGRHLVSSASPKRVAAPTLKNPVLILTALAVLYWVFWASLAGRLPLFKGLDEMQQMAFSQTLGAGDYFTLAVVQTRRAGHRGGGGFRGGRIFRLCFIGAALGLVLHAHIRGRTRGDCRSPARFLA